MITMQPDFIQRKLQSVPITKPMTLIDHFCDLEARLYAITNILILRKHRFQVDSIVLCSYRYVFVTIFCIYMPRL